jgi:hypothetical protein
LNAEEKIERAKQLVEKKRKEKEEEEKQVTVCVLHCEQNIYRFPSQSVHGTSPSGIFYVIEGFKSFGMLHHSDW